MFLTALLSLVAGLLTVLAPCVLPFLPVIVGGSVRGDRWRPFIVAASLVASLMAFTVLLKVTTVAIGIDPRVWAIASGVLVIVLGVFMLVPDLWARIATRTGFDRGSHELLEQASDGRSGVASAVLTGLALGPVFSSCSPTYAWIIAAVLPASPLAGLLHLSLYCLGVAAALLAISLMGRSLISRIRWAADPRGWFQRLIAILFILVGVFVATGLDKRFQTWAVDWVPSLGAVEEALVEEAAGAPEREDQNADAGLVPEERAARAPEFAGITEWINSDPLTLESLRGKVVLVDFWTYSCINCIRTQPYLNSWYETYHDQGLEIVGVHAPEFAFEKLPENVRRAVEDAKITYPVALDNDFLTWGAYENRYWPAKYLIDQEGRVRWFHAGEGHYEEAESAIRALLDARGERSQVTTSGAASGAQSPETYLGSQRASGHVGEGELSPGRRTFGAASQLAEDEWTLGGTWTVAPQSITADEDGSTLSYRFRGTDVFLVLNGETGQRVSVDVEGASDWHGADVEEGAVTLDSNRLYHLVHLSDGAGGGTLTLTLPRGVSAYAFTFGS